MIDLSIDEEALERAVGRARERNIVIPTLAQMRDPSLLPDRIREVLRRTGLWELSPHNLCRITWKNEPVDAGGGFGTVNIFEFPSRLTGVEARIIALAGKWFPTGSHKVGAAFGCMVPRLVTGQFDPTSHKAVWPSTGNFCRGGAYDSALLGCESIAVLPGQMSRERFEWLAGIAGEVIRTPGGESDVKEIFDRCRELQRTNSEVIVFNQFEDFGNYLWHFSVTGPAMAEVLERESGAHDALRGLVLASGSAGTLAAGDYLKQVFPGIRIAVSEAWQCPTLLENGFGGHRIEGIGDKHVPWIHNVKNTDMVIGVDDDSVVRLARLFHEPAGQALLASLGIGEDMIAGLDLLGFSGICNLVSAVKFARYYELGCRDIVLTVLTDSMELYLSRLGEMRAAHGDFTERDAVGAEAQYLRGITTDHMRELTYPDRRRIHNLKYFTWVEQQGRTPEELTAQWHDAEYWTRIQKQAQDVDALIGEFNRRVRSGPRD